MTRTDPCPLFVEWVENWAPDYLADATACGSGEFNVTQREPCARRAGHAPPCRAATPHEMVARGTLTER